MKRAFFALALITAACTPPQNGAQRPDDGGGDSAFAANTSTIFAGEKALELTEPCSRTPPGPIDGTWTPTQAEIDAMEPALAQLVSETLRTQWPETTDVDIAAYHRQYGGLVLGGRRVIYVNGFRLNEQDTDVWRDFPHIICDGGPIMFGAEYDPETRTFGNFAFNGIG